MPRGQGTAFDEDRLTAGKLEPVGNNACAFLQFLLHTAQLIPTATQRLTRDRKDSRCERQYLRHRLQRLNLLPEEKNGAAHPLMGEIFVREIHLHKVNYIIFKRLGNLLDQLLSTRKNVIPQFGESLEKFVLVFDAHLNIYELFAHGIDSGSQEVESVEFLLSLLVEGHLLFEEFGN